MTDSSTSWAIEHRRGVSHLLRVAAFAYAIFLVIATHHPRPSELFGTRLPGDKTLHVAAYTMLGLLVAAVAAARGGWSLRQAIVIIVGLAVFGACDEITQPWFGRDGDPLDWVCDCLGITTGVFSIAAVVAFARWRRRHRAVAQ